MRYLPALVPGAMALACLPFPSLAQSSTPYTICTTDTAGNKACMTGSISVTPAAVPTPVPTPTPTPTPVPNPVPTTASYTCVRNWYVATNGNDGAAGSSSAPWATIAGADASGKLAAGDCVNLASGTYSTGSTAYLTHGGNANSATGYVVYRSPAAHGAKIKASSRGMYDLVNVTGNYVIFDGLEIDGGNEGLTSNPMTGGHCLEFDGHHSQALNNLIHDCGGAAISGVYQDWYTFIGNTVYNNALFNGYQASGISIFEPRAVSYTATAADTSATYHIIIQNNIAYNNSEKYVSGAHTDGNGIILDDFANSQSGGAAGAYPYKSLVQGNTAYNNGGGGVHLFYSDNVTVDSNIAYLNYNDAADSAAWRGDINAIFSNNCTFTNNNSTSSVGKSVPLSYNTAAADLGPNKGNTWNNNATFDNITKARSFQSDTISAAAFAGTNPVGVPR